MNFLGMGIPEVGVILLVAFLVLGPGRSIDMARSAGKILGDLRRSFNDVTSAVSIEVTEQRANGQDRREESPLEPPPGVPVRAEIPPEDEEETDSGSGDKAGSEDKG
ncbi:MAG: twin-arginine translocase TatA/TatE family subunit [Chloroflexi bacterium]|nr:twin-arginine translocase TatA/TatE family subunit [Chloroflexota bacterium]